MGRQTYRGSIATLLPAGAVTHFLRIRQLFESSVIFSFDGSRVASDTFPSEIETHFLQSTGTEVIYRVVTHL